MHTDNIIESVKAQPALSEDKTEDVYAAFTSGRLCTCVTAVLDN